LLDTPIEERFERITRMVCRLMDVPIAIFNLIDEDRQHYKSVQGLCATNAPLGPAFCTHALLEEDMLLVPDAKKDDRFHDNPFVSGELLNIAFYAGCPVKTANGLPIGTLCAIDTKPREMSQEQLSVLRDLAAIIETELKVSSLSKSEKILIEELSEAKRLALIDPLTRLWNRGGIEQLLEKEWSTSLRNNKPFTVVMCDIDHFKKVNDTYGHPAGDAVLVHVAKKLLECVRSEDIVGRVGGEEFVIFLTDCQPGTEFETVDRIRQRIMADTIVADDNLLQVTMSFGVASCMPSDEVDGKSLIKRADEALYFSKNNGRNQVKVSE
jgi:diguanylate cyclase (GGDEF)-like protein